MRRGHRLRLLVLALFLAVVAVIVLAKTAGSRPLAGDLPKPVDDGAALDPYKDPSLHATMEG